MHIILTDYAADLCVKENNTSLNDAINKFFDIIVESEEPDVFQKFITALKQNGKLCCSFKTQIIAGIYVILFHVSNLLQTIFDKI